MEEPVDGIFGGDAELAEVESFIGSALGPPSCLLLEGPVGIGKRRCGTPECPSLGHEVIGCSPAVRRNRRPGFPTRRSVTSLTFSFLICLARRSARWTLRSSEQRSRMLHRTSERCRSHRWELCARWPRLAW
jgi:hypothetical protein